MILTSLAFKNWPFNTCDEKHCSNHAMHLFYAEIKGILSRIESRVWNMNIWQRLWKSDPCIFSLTLLLFLSLLIARALPDGLPIAHLSAHKPKSYSSVRNRVLTAAPIEISSSIARSNKRLSCSYTLVTNATSRSLWRNKSKDEEKESAPFDLTRKWRCPQHSAQRQLQKRAGLMSVRTSIMRRCNFVMSMSHILCRFSRWLVLYTQTIRKLWGCYLYWGTGYFCGHLFTSAMKSDLYTSGSNRDEQWLGTSKNKIF